MAGRREVALPLYGPAGQGSVLVSAGIDLIFLSVAAVFWI